MILHLSLSIKEALWDQPSVLLMGHTYNTYINTSSKLHSSASNLPPNYSGCSHSARTITPKGQKDWNIQRITSRTSLYHTATMTNDGFLQQSVWTSENRSCSYGGEFVPKTKSPGAAIWHKALMGINHGTCWGASLTASCSSVAQINQILCSSSSWTDWMINTFVIYMYAWNDIMARCVLNICGNLMEYNANSLC